MGRQMFAKGGAAFPDLSGDGNVTQKDILMGRGVIPMQQGGMAPMPMPAAPAAPTMDPGMPAIDPNTVDINQAAQGAMQNGLDPAMMEGMLTQYAQGMEDLENAEDYETVMNGIRGDDLPIEQRYQELASVVGPEDAQQTPESVLALVQPVMMLAAVDQGIGGLAAEEMSAPVEGAMAEGIMSTVNMGAPEAPTQVPGGPAPVNFNQGGAVQYMNVGGAADPSRMQTLYNEQLALMNQIDDPATREANLAEQQKMTKAGILFDIAQGALSFAGGAGRPGATPAEQLASAFTPVVGNIGARAGELNKFKQSQTAQDRQLRLGAMQGAQQAYQGELTRAAAAANVKPGDTYQIKDDAGTVLWQGPIGTVGQQQSLMTKFPTAVSVTEVTTPEKADYQNFVNTTTNVVETLDVSTPGGRRAADKLTASGFRSAGKASLDSDQLSPKLQVVVNKNNTDDVRQFNLNDPEQLKLFNALDSTIYLPVSTPTIADLADSGKSTLGNSYEANFIELVANPDTLQAYADGTLHPYEANTINSFITNETRLKPVFDQTQQQWVLKPAFLLSPAVQNAVAARRSIEGASLPTVGATSFLEMGGGEGDDVTEVGRIKFDPETGNPVFDDFKDDITFIITGVDLTQSQDWRSSVNRFFNNFVGQTGLGESGYAGESGEITSKADTELKALGRKIISVARSGVDGKVFALDIAMLKEEVDGFMPGGGKTDIGARDQLVTVRNNLASMYSQALTVVNDPAAAANKNEFEKKEQLLASVENLIAETTAAIAIYDRFLSTDPIADAVRDRSVTSTLKRANDGED